MKQYTKLRQFYAWVGFISLIIFTCYGIYRGIDALTKPDQELIITPEPVQIIEVTNETPPKTEEEYIPIQPVYHVQQPTFQAPVYVPRVQNRTPEPIEEDEQSEQVDTDSEWRSLCNDLVDLTGSERENYPRSMKSYRACADTFLGIAQNMANGGLAGNVFTAQLEELSTEYQTLLGV